MCQYNINDAEFNEDIKMLTLSTYNTLVKNAPKTFCLHFYGRWFWNNFVLVHAGPILCIYSIDSYFYPF
jgi:hypothetical protein